MSVTILGSGTCVPSLRRSSCSILMKIRDKFLLFDSGAGTMRKLLEISVEIFDVSCVFYSHFHPDHTAELVPFLFANKYPDGSRRKIPLTLMAGKGFAKFYDDLKKVYGHWIELAPDLLTIGEFDNTSYDMRMFDDFKVESLPVDHNPESIAYRITSSGGKSVVYSGDTDVSENLVTLSKDADLLICESALPDELKVKGHLTPSLAGEIADRANVCKLVLTHFYPECDQVDIEKECRKTYSGPLLLAEDLMQINL
ncbi:MAG: MBL fold metallo-hydrolase [Deltaproteobacteria bacterium]|nr:MBL fold metallo-hydrolase [Deltaproteobacteria bacterium]MBW1959105.1 MBL fold metallo-hydrolase [Deltaproteobacteria bacterium]MBW2014268.1 MBL fold metallo-hydrolase [Deltaproteobacteria bacterium]MBW2089717.1 MBL fold metallo-hydrolase [Deltaproteobacteria bacterium]MBW2320866.1 MBL fold metallo-hydrolase [Deltaproteobacteria bacterium]